MGATSVEYDETHISADTSKESKEKSAEILKELGENMAREK